VYEQPLWMDLGQRWLYSNFIKILFLCVLNQHSVFPRLNNPQFWSEILLHFCFCISESRVILVMTGLVHTFSQ